MTQNQIIFAVSMFLLTYVVNVIYITVFYHRGLAHSAVGIPRWLRAVIVHSGNWVTGLDPKGWACMHRMHHLYSDTPLDPHSPDRFGIWGVYFAQLTSYKKCLVGLARKMPAYSQIVSDLDFEVYWLNRKKLWMMPYVVHAIIAVALCLIGGHFLIGVAYFGGLMSHPIQGWMVNAFAHRFGYRNFKTSDHSTNNTLVAWLVFGEGFQNNHHRFPKSAKFSVRWFEVDMGYGLCRLMHALRIIRINVNTLARSDSMLKNLQPAVLQENY